MCIKEKEIAVLNDISLAILRLELPHWAILVSFSLPITHYPNTSVSSREL